MCKANNMVGLAALGSLCLLRSARLFLVGSLFIITVGGILVWCFGRPALHIGASGWIFGLWSLSIALALFDRRPANLLLATVVILLYGGMVYGVLPGDPGVSFESHLAGAIAGFCWAFLYTRKQRRH